MRLKASTQVALGILLAFVLLVVAAVWLGRDDDGSGRTVVRFRLWDTGFVSAYRASFDEFERQHPDIEVRIDVVPFASYPQKLRLDVAGGTADDIFWTNLYEDYADNGRLLDIGRTLGPAAQRQWDPRAVAQYTRNGKLWGVPQFVDGGTAVFYNRNLLDAAHVDPAELDGLRWSDDDNSDTLRPLLRRLTMDSHGNTAATTGFDANAVAQYGYNAGNDYQSLLLPYVGSAGGHFQGAGGALDFDSPEGRMALEYLVRLVHTDRVAPSAADTNSNGDFARNAFLQGKLALFQSGTFNLRQIADGAKFPWGVARMPAGPKGRVTADNAIAAVGNAATHHPDAVRKLLAWIGSPAGNKFLGTDGLAIPAVTALQQDYRTYWRSQGIDTSAFFDVVSDSSLSPGTGAQFPQAQLAVDAVFDEMFLGRIPVPKALAEAQRDGDAALAPK